MKITVQKLICLSICVTMLLVLFAGCGQEPVDTPTNVKGQSVVPAETSDASAISSQSSSSVKQDDLVSEEMPSQPDDSSNPEQTPGGDEAPVIIDPSIIKPRPEVTEKPDPVTIRFCSVYADSGNNEVWKNGFFKLEREGLITDFSHMNSELAVEHIYKEVLAGREGAQVYEVPLGMSRQLAVKKVLANVLDSKTLNKERYQSNGSFCNTIGGKTYGLTLNANAHVPMLLYNKEFMKQFAPDTDIATLVAENRWNFDTFRTLAKQCTTDTDGDGKPNVYGITGGADWIRGVLVTNAGGYGVMNEGKVLSTISLPQGEEALEFCKSLFKVDRSWKYYATPQKSAENFAKGFYGMLSVSSLDVAEIVKGLSFAWGLAPVPASAQQTNSTYCVMDTRVFVIPRTAGARLDDIGNWFNGMAEVNQDLLDQVTCEWDQQTAAMYQNILNNTCVDYATEILSENALFQIDVLVTSSPKTPYPSRLKVANQMVQNELDVFWAPLYDN